MDDIILYEELSMNAHPSIKTHAFDGWILRFANGYTNRANSVNPLYESHMVSDEKISRCEEIYKSQGLATVFKLTPHSIKPLDEMLVAKGYEVVTPTILMDRSLTTWSFFETNAVVTDKISMDWQENYFRLNGVVNESSIKTAKEIQGNIINKTLCASIVENGTVIACGLCVIERGYAGLYDIVVDCNYHGKGLGFDICVSLLNNAVKIGAKTAYLQVVAANIPAVALYSKLGFTENYQYWYRIKA